MKWIGLVLVLLVTCQLAGAQNAAPVAAIPLVHKWVSVTDPQERAFQVEVPQGWKVEGGTMRRNALQFRSWVKSVSPDGNTILLINDPSEWSYVIPTPLLAMSGFREGSIYGGGAGTLYTVAHYRDGRQFAV